MPGLLESCKLFFGRENLYEVLDVPKKATVEEIKKAYRRLSLKIHPDRVVDSEKDEATEKFKVLSKVHCVLSDKEKRACYDETGCIDDDESEFEQRDWYTYWRNLFKQITDEDIVNYEKKYLNSEEEKSDLIDAYKSSKGDIDMILEKVPFSHPGEVDRYKDILQPLIDSNELPRYKEFVEESPRKQELRKRKYAREEKEVLRKSKKKGKIEENLVENDLVAAMAARRQQRSTDFENMCANLEAKYGNKKVRSGGKRK